MLKAFRCAIFRRSSRSAVDLSAAKRSRRRPRSKTHFGQLRVLHTDTKHCVTRPSEPGQYRMQYELPDICIQRTPLMKFDAANRRQASGDFDDTEMNRFCTHAEKLFILEQSPQKTPKITHAMEKLQRRPMGPSRILIIIIGFYMGTIDKQNGRLDVVGDEIPTCNIRKQTADIINQTITKTTGRTTLYDS